MKATREMDSIQLTGEYSRREAWNECSNDPIDEEASSIWDMYPLLPCGGVGRSESARGEWREKGNGNRISRDSGAIWAQESHGHIQWCTAKALAYRDGAQDARHWTFLCGLSSHQLRWIPAMPHGSGQKEAGLIHHHHKKSTECRETQRTFGSVESSQTSSSLAGFAAFLTQEGSVWLRSP